MTITYEDIIKAQETQSDVIRKTSLSFSATFSKICGANVYLKNEYEQKTGSFKIRGALNFISQSKNQDFVAPSSGNHAQGVAAAARLYNKNSTLVMPSDAPLSKIQGVKFYGGNIISVSYTHLTLPTNREV